MLTTRGRNQHMFPRQRRSATNLARYVWRGCLAGVRDAKRLVRIEF